MLERRAGTGKSCPGPDPRAPSRARQSDDGSTVATVPHTGHLPSCRSPVPGAPIHTDPVPPPDEQGPRAARWVFALLAYLFVALALVGVAVPGLPTFPFLLLAAWAASRGSKRVHDWLHDHPRFGPALTRWREEGAISRRSKITAVGLIVLSWTILFWRLRQPHILIPLAFFFAAISAFLLSRPEPADPPGD